LQGIIFLLKQATTQENEAVIMQKVILNNGIEMPTGSPKPGNR
jgi:hypothetical protein